MNVPLQNYGTRCTNTESNFITLRLTVIRNLFQSSIGGKIFSTRRRGAAISIDRDLVAPLDFYYRFIAPTNRE